MSATSGPENQKTNNKASETSTGAGAPTSKGRRRLAQATLSAPVIMTLFSRPAWGQTAICGSITGSKIRSKGVRCLIGCSPAFWCKHTDLWVQATGLSPGTPFNTAFPLCDVDGGPFLNSTLETVICAIFMSEPRPDFNDKFIQDCASGAGGGDPVRKCTNTLQKLGYHAVASLLNALAVENPANNLPEEVDFPFTSDQVRSLTCTAINKRSDSDWDDQHRQFEIANESGCQVLEKELGLNPFGDL